MNDSTAARSENRTKSLRFEGLTLKLPAKVPFNAFQYIPPADGAEIFAFLESILGAEQVEKIKETDFDIDKGAELINLITEKMGLSPGK